MQQQLQSELFREESRSAGSMRKRKPSLFSSREHPPSRDIPEVPGMITRDEGAYYYFWLRRFTAVRVRCLNWALG